MYAGAAALQRALIFLLLPVFTRAFSPGEYGRLSVLLAIASAAIIVLSLGLDTAFFRTYFRLRSDRTAQERFVRTTWTFLLIAPAALAIVAGTVSAPLLREDGLISPTELGLALAGAALFVSANVVPMAVLRAEERLAEYLILTLATAIATAAATLIGVVALDGGVLGWLIGVAVANTITLVLATRLIPFRTPGRPDRELLLPALALGIPLIPHMLSHWGLGISNRLVLAGFVDPTDLGIYALAANVALPVAIVMQGMAQGFMPSFARAATESESLAALRRVIDVQVLLVLAVTTAGALLGPVATRFLAPPEYADAAALVPWLALGYGFLGLYFIPMNAVALTAGRTGKVWLLTVAAAATNLSCLVLLVPRIGLLGAALSASVGYLVLLVGVTAYSHGADNPVRYSWSKICRAILVFAALYVAARETSGDRSLMDAAIRVAWIGCCLPLLVAARVVALATLRRAARACLPTSAGTG